MTLEQQWLKNVLEGFTKTNIQIMLIHSSISLSSASLINFYKVRFTDSETADTALLLRHI